MTAERDQQAERDHAEFAGWFEAQGYTTGAFESDSMAEAFTAGMTAARDLAAVAEPQPAPERDKPRDALEDIARAAQGSIDASLPPDHDWLVSRAMEGLGWLPEGWPKAPKPAPELAAAMRETRGYRERLASIRKLCEARIKVVGMVDGKGVARKVIAIIDKPEAS